MNKTNDEENPGGNGARDTTRTVPGMTPQTILETMKTPTFTAEQLPELWEQATGSAGAPLTLEARDRWLQGIEALYRRCETYPQHTKIAAILSGMPPGAYLSGDGFRNQADNLLKQAEPEQLRQALAYEQRQQQPDGWWTVREHLMRQAEPEQFTGTVVAQYAWDNAMATYVTMLDEETVECGRNRRRRQISETLQNQLLGGSDDAWVVFLGIIEPGDNIGETATLATAIAQNRTRTGTTRTSRNSTIPAKPDVG